MKLSSLLDEHFILFGGDNNTVEECVSDIIDAFYKKHSFSVPKSEVLHQIFEREKLGITTLVDGIIMPHARLENFNDLLVGIAKPRNVLKYDNNNVFGIIVVLASLQSPKKYLNVVSGIAKLFLDKNASNDFLSLKSPDKIIEYVEKKSIEIEKSITVADIMSPTPQTINSNQSIHELIDLFFMKNISYAPVVNDSEILIGEVTVNEIIKFGIPSYASMMKNLNFLRNFEPFEEMLTKGREHKVKEIMKKPYFKLMPDASIIEAAFEFSNNHRRHIPIVDNNDKVIGIVSYMDILKKVLRS
ncbi:CBS domain-containing protein [Candidatus Dependentiae bacterium]|nr:CBS domain-containing protein [Candidatus Dependentiae bacterium]